MVFYFNPISYQQKHVSLLELHFRFILQLILHHHYVYMQGVSTCHPTVHIWRSQTTLCSQFSPPTLRGFRKVWRPSLCPLKPCCQPWAVVDSITVHQSPLSPMGMEHLMQSTWCKSYSFPQVLFVSGMAFVEHSLWWRGGHHPTTIEAHSRQKVLTWSKKEENGCKWLRPYLGPGLLRKDASCSRTSLLIVYLVFAFLAVIWYRGY